MTRPSPEVMALVDELVAQLDADTIDEPYTPPATASYEVIVAAWERFASLVAGLSVAVGDPFAKGATDTLSRAAALYGHDVYMLSFWLPHVGKAIARRALALPLS